MFTAVVTEGLAWLGAGPGAPAKFLTGTVINVCVGNPGKSGTVAGRAAQTTILGPRAHRVPLSMA